MAYIFALTAAKCCIVETTPRHGYGKEMVGQRSLSSCLRLPSPAGWNTNATDTSLDAAIIPLEESQLEGPFVTKSRVVRVS
jgi:hypothetical protein